MKISLKMILLFALSYVIGIVASYFIGGFFLVIIYTMIWFDKILLANLKIHGEFGVELSSLPVILFAIVYGPILGFFFGFLIHAFVGGILSILAWRITTPYASAWSQIFPSGDTIIMGLTGLFAGFLWGAGAGLFFTVLIVMVIRNVLYYPYDIVIYGIYKLSRPLNILFNVVLVLLLHDILLLILSA